MTPFGKIIVGIIVLLAVGLGWMAYSSRPQESGENMQPSDASAQAAATPAQDAAAGITARGSSDAALDADLKDLDSQIDAATQSSASVDSSMSDKAGDVSY